MNTNSNCCCGYYHFDRKSDCVCEVHRCKQPSVESKCCEKCRENHAQPLDEKKYFQACDCHEISLRELVKRADAPSHPHSPIGWRERFDKEFWLHRVPSNTKQANDIKSFIAQEIAAAEERVISRIEKYVAENRDKIERMDRSVLDGVLEAARSTKEV